MVLISEIAGGNPNEEEEGRKEEEGPAEEELKVDGEKGSPEKPHEPAGSGGAAGEVKESPVKGPQGSSAGQTHYNEYALRVAYIMRSYLDMRRAGVAGAGQGPPAREAAVGDRCKAMMEVVRKEHGMWTVSKLVVEHNHELLPNKDADGDGAGLVPAVGMEFDSVEVAKAFYYGYGEKSGFKARTGSNRRSAGSGHLIMQRFLCWRGNYLMYKKNSDAGAGKVKRGPYKKRARRLAEEPAAAAAARKDGDVVEVIQVESSTEKGGVAGDDHGVEVQSGPPLKEQAVVEKDAGQKPPAPVVGMPVPAAAAAARKDDGKAIPVANTAQSRLLRELGVRASRYTQEERRDIILKYTMKKTNRQVVESPVKVPSRQALAERRQRGIGGRFLSRHESPTSSSQDKRTEAEPAVPAEDVANLGGEPKVGMVFANEDKAYEFYVKYAGTVGFSVRKGWWDKSARNVTRSRVYVCSREGFRPRNVANDAKKPRTETRTGCLARMAIKITPSGKYSISEFVADHNHQLAAPLDVQMLRSQRVLAKVQPEGCQNTSLIPADYKNYLRSKRMKDMKLGDAGSLLEYLQKMKSENPSFFYAIQVDERDQLTNIFWVDAKSMMDYHYFGDVVCFDTAYKTNDYDRPFALFLGVNHHKQIIVFGAALLYDETIESFKWLFETFKTAMGGRQPRTILTDCCATVSDAVAAVWPGTMHRLCLWQIHQDASKRLSHVFEGSETFALDISRCLYDCEDEEEFLLAWETMLERYDLKDNEWLGKLYEEREKWALVYRREIFCADIANALRNENLNTVLKEYLKLETDLLSFFNQYDRLVEERRYAEQQANYQANQGTSRIPPLRLLWQAANVYTPAVFEMFKLEFELTVNCTVYSCAEVGTISQYEVTVKDKTKERSVRFDSADGTALCSCKKFEFSGVQCCHVLKILDLRNIKELPLQYVLKRWRKDAKVGSIRENHRFALDGDPKSSIPKRYSSLCQILYKIAAMAAENAEAYSCMESQSDQLLERVERILQARLLEMPSPSTASKVQPRNLVPNKSNIGESPRASGKRKKNGDAHHRNQNGFGSNKRQKGRQDVKSLILGLSDEAEIETRSDELPASSDEILAQPRNPPNQFFVPSQFMQGPYVSGHQFGLSTVQGFHNMTQFSQMQESSTSLLQQQPFHGNTQLGQNDVQACSAADVQSLQFGGSNPQLGHQSSDQGHYSIPVWDFL
ncbi:protein FAR1-RELATED SEQUENCE 4-like isoform X1 [Phoenix dactylifera]|uniref:Protein FAR1-RELATED SEQUENCE 4-like isoform X1 n=1 Tax=Phoenix dactylifera TaxID=42345 RepID=A0A8B8ZEX4_PHODC|nr:protein FAR1-RELATED SEQUENCE 4-like isoform X1 [Phoenix dactylifera]XP_038970415.1 protein FAR1-RELATED SEQUENCE 4-like isoform X1 [Phoenix dactylifera]